MTSQYKGLPVASSSFHYVLFDDQCHAIPEADLAPMPHSPTFIHVPSEKPMWDVVKAAFSDSPIRSFESLRKAILSYKQYDQSINSFRGLKTFLQKKLSKEEQERFFNHILPKILSLALSLLKVVRKPIPMLNASNSFTSISLTQKQIGVLLANAFLCTFPDQQIPKDGLRCGYGDRPDLNFNRLFMRTDAHTEHKFKCIFNYFDRITTTEPDGVVTFSLQSIPMTEMPNFALSTKPLGYLKVEVNGVIENATDHLQVDFADKYIGGMIFTKGCVQEEIRFLYCPELIVARLFTRVLGDTEALVITGVEQYNEGKGYSSSFKYTGSLEDETAMDGFGRKRCEVVAIDALSFTWRIHEQYYPKNVDREIQKAYAGFRPLSGVEGPYPKVASGNWGCGVYRGNAKLKGLLQLIAASEAGRDLTYFAFGRKKLADQMTALYKELKQASITTGELTSILKSFGEDEIKRKGEDLYGFIRHKIKNIRGGV